MEQDEYNRKSEYNYQIIRSDISKLMELLNPFPYSFNSKDFWNYVKTVNTNFKSLKPLKKNEREELWKDFQNLCVKAKSIQKSNNDDFEYKSKKSKEEILHFIKYAKLNASDNSKKSNELLGNAMQLMKSSRLTKDDREKCWVLWKNAKDDVNFESVKKRKNNYNFIKDKVSSMSSTAVYGDPKQALDEIKNIQGILRNYPMDDVYWNEIKSSLATYWNKAQSRLDEHYREKNREYQEKQDNWRRNQEDFIDKLEGFYSNNENFIDKLRDEIDDLRDKIRSAYSDNYINRVEGWISEREYKIAEVMRKNYDLKEKISEVKYNLNK